MKKMVKNLIKTTIVMFSFFLIYTSNVYADQIVNADDYKPPAIVNGGKVAEIGNVIIGGIQLIGSIVSVIALIMLGIKYMVGSVEEKAEYKEAMMPYIIGAVMLFTITNLLGIISAIFS